MAQEFSTSIALCSYNGERYIEEQLNSFLTQTILPDELVICDDCSIDRTIAIIKDFITKAPFPVRLYINSQNLGSTPNFEKAIPLCQGDIIFLCDQDDIWSPEKISHTMHKFEDNSVAAVFSNAQIVDKYNQSLGYKLWDTAPYTRKQQRLVAKGSPLRALLKHNFITGSTLAFRKKYIPALLPIPKEWIHDGWIALMLAVKGKLVGIDQPLIRYRQHQENQIGNVRESIWNHLRNTSEKLINGEDYLVKARCYHQAYQRFEKALTPKLKDNFIKKINHYQTRGKLNPNRVLRIPSVMRELILGNYHNYGYGWQSFGSDLLYKRFKKG